MAKDVMDSKVVMMDASATVNDAIKKMVSSDTWSILIEKNGLPIGVPTERDIFRRCLGIGSSADKMRVEEIMSSPIVSVVSGLIGWEQSWTRWFRRTFAVYS